MKYCLDVQLGVDSLSIIVNSWRRALSRCIYNTLLRSWALVPTCTVQTYTVWYSPSTSSWQLGSSKLRFLHFQFCPMDNTWGWQKSNLKSISSTTSKLRFFGVPKIPMDRPSRPSDEQNKHLRAGTLKHNTRHRSMQASTPKHIPRYRHMQYCIAGATLNGEFTFTHHDNYVIQGQQRMPTAVSR